MKTILIATDFSKASRNASIYGLHLARSINAKVILFSAYQIPSPVAGLGVSISRYDVMEQMKQKLLDEAYRITYINMPEIKIVCDEGVPAEAIINMANEKKADFIIAGMKGSGKGFKKIFGSTATALAKSTSIPVIIVPENASFKQPSTILFASDKNIKSDKAIPQNLLAITRLFKSKLYIVKVIKDETTEFLELSDFSGLPKEISQFADITVEYPVDSDITHALNRLIKKRHADMLVMKPHKHDWTERLFRKSETKDMIFHTHIPLLVLPENISNDIGYLETFASSKNAITY